MLMNSITMMMQLEFEGRLTGFQLGLSILAAVSSADLGKFLDTLDDGLHKSISCKPGMYTYVYIICI